MLDEPDVRMDYIAPHVPYCVDGRAEDFFAREDLQLAPGGRKVHLASQVLPDSPQRDGLHAERGAPRVARHGEAKFRVACFFIPYGCYVHACARERRDANAT